MRFFHAGAVMTVICAFAGFAAGAATKSTVAKKVTSSSVKSVKKSTATAHTVSKSPASSSTAKKATSKAVVSASASKRAKGKAVKATPAATWRTRQQVPTPERYKEIQQALVDKGYLKGEPSGVWDADSAGAMQRFQMDQKLTPTGKINAPSLIGLGLGAKSAGAPEAAPVRQDGVPVPAPAPPLVAPGSQ